MGSRIHLILFLLITLGCYACSKDKDRDDGRMSRQYQGNVYFKWADEGTFKLDLKTGQKSLLLPSNVKQNGFDMSRKQDKILVLEDIQGDYDHEVFKIINIKDGNIVNSIKVEVGEHSGYTNPHLSYDESYILATSFLPEKVIIIDIAKDKTYILNEIQGKKFSDAVWMPDGSVLLCTEKAIYQSSIPFDEVKLIKSFDFDSWRFVAVSPDGKKIALNGGKHVWLMDNQGGNLKQITNSNTEEGSVAFSPDSKNLLVGVRQFAGGAGTWGEYYTMYIIPADGNQYTIEEDKSTEKVSMVVSKGDDSPQAYNKSAQWL